MESNQTLASIMRSGSQQQSQNPVPGEDVSQSFVFNAYLTVYAVNLSQRFPDISDLNRIDYNTVKKIAEFCIPTTLTAVNVWREHTEKSGLTRQPRAA